MFSGHRPRFLSSEGWNPTGRAFSHPAPKEFWSHCLRRIPPPFITSPHRPFPPFRPFVLAAPLPRPLQMWWQKVLGMCCMKGPSESPDTQQHSRTPVHRPHGKWIHLTLAYGAGQSKVKSAAIRYISYPQFHKSIQNPFTINNWAVLCLSVTNCQFKYNLKKKNKNPKTQNKTLFIELWEKLFCELQLVDSSA